MESKTPRTDAVLAEYKLLKSSTLHYPAEQALTGLSRQLETELATQAARIEGLERSTYDAIADAVTEVANAAAEAFEKAGLKPGEWDGDNIVVDVSRGIADDIERLAALAQKESTGGLP